VPELPDFAPKRLLFRRKSAEFAPKNANSVGRAMSANVTVKVIGEYIVTLLTLPTGETLAWLNTPRGVANHVLAYRQALLEINEKHGQKTSDEN
jgi:hypothetical protein